MRAWDCCCARRGAAAADTAVAAGAATRPDVEIDYDTWNLFDTALPEYSEVQQLRPETTSSATSGTKSRRLRKLEEKHPIPEEMVQELVLEGHPREGVLRALRESYKARGEYNTDLAWTFLNDDLVVQMVTKRRAGSPTLSARL